MDAKRRLSSSPTNTSRLSTKMTSSKTLRPAGSVRSSLTAVTENFGDVSPLWGTVDDKWVALLLICEGLCQLVECCKCCCWV